MDKWLRSQTRQVHRGKIFSHKQVELTSPASQKTGVFDILEFHNWVNVFAITPDQQIVLVRQYRVGTDQVSLEVPGGAIEQGEDPMVAAKRELEEETGYTCSGELIPLGNVAPNPAFMTNRCWFYLAENVEKTKEQNLDPLEEVEVVTKSLDEFEQALNSGKIDHSLVVSGFYFFKNYQREK